MGDLERQEPVETVRLTVGEEKASETYSRDELMKLSNTPCWNMTRRILLALFWLLWCGAIVWSVIIVVKSPKCKAEPDQAWFTKGGCAELQATSETAVEQLKAIEPGKYEAIVISGILGDFTALQSNMNQPELEEVLTNIKNAALSKNAKVIHKVDLTNGGLNDNLYTEFFDGFLNIDATTDGIIFTNPDTPSIDTIRSANPQYTIFYDTDDISNVLADRKDNEYFYKKLDSLENSREFLSKTITIENNTISSIVETLWNAGDQEDSLSPSDNAMFSAVLPGGFVVPVGNREYDNLITLRGKYHSLRAITGATIKYGDDSSIERKFDLRPAILLSDDADDEKWEPLYNNTNFEILKEII